MRSERWTAVSTAKLANQLSCEEDCVYGGHNSLLKVQYIF